MKTVFDKPNEQCQTRLDIAVARKRGLKANLFILGAMVCFIKEMADVEIEAIKSAKPRYKE